MHKWYKCNAFIGYEQCNEPLLCYRNFDCNEEVTDNSFLKHSCNPKKIICYSLGEGFWVWTGKGWYEILDKNITILKLPKIRKLKQLMIELRIGNTNM